MRSLKINGIRGNVGKAVAVFGLAMGFASAGRCVVPQSIDPYVIVKLTLNNVSISACPDNPKPLFAPAGFTGPEDWQQQAKVGATIDDGKQCPFDKGADKTYIPYAYYPAAGTTEKGTYAWALVKVAPIDNYAILDAAPGAMPRCEQGLVNKYDLVVVVDNESIESTLCP